MVHQFLIIDDEATALLSQLFRSFSNEKQYQFMTCNRVSDPPWEWVDRADMIFIGFTFAGLHSGVEFLRVLRAERPLLRKPVVLLSAPTDIRDSQWQECLDLGVNDFICKTTPPEIVKRKVDTILEGEYYRTLSDELKAKLQFEEARSPIESLDFSTIASLIPDANEWAYTLRIILKEGPLHRRQAYGFFLAVFNDLLLRLSGKCQKQISPYPFDTIDGDLQESSSPLQHPKKTQPDHAAAPAANRPPDVNRTVPLGMPARLMTTVFQNDPAKIADFTKYFLTGPPHDVFMNVLLLHICESFHDMIGASAPAEGKKA
jgi:DNA-binding NarL/FixJ family response regulator